MVSEICREMIEDSPIAYAKIKINKIEENFILDKILYLIKILIIIIY